MTAKTAPAGDDRLRWLDIARVLCALMILGIHWLRACFNMRMFGTGDPVNLIFQYQGHTGGLALFHYVLIGGSGPSVSGWLTNSIGLLGGFGWEAVSALILISGFSLALAQRGRRLDFGGWFTWYRKRAQRILVPYYLIALPFLALSALAIYAFSPEHGYVATLVEEKLRSQFWASPGGVLFSHLFLFEPWARQWAANFLAPAWWFVPAILVAYLLYPALRKFSRVWHGIPLLACSAAVTIGSYLLVAAGVLTNEMWYFIALQESFNFCLGVVLAGWWLGGRRALIERIVGDSRAFFPAFATFVIGNIANWSTDFRPIASMLYGPSLVVMIAYIALRLERHAIGRTLAGFDAYDLYLVHQPFAFPIAILANIAFHSYGVFCGWFIFVAVAAVAARVASAAQRIGPVRRRLLASPRHSHAPLDALRERFRDVVAIRIKS